VNLTKKGVNLKFSKKKNKKENDSLKNEMPLGVGTAFFEVPHILWRADFAW
jgi:hypothetical protein